MTVFRDITRASVYHIILSVHRMLNKDKMIQALELCFRTQPIIYSKEDYKLLNNVINCYFYCLKVYREIIILNFHKNKLY